jgi:hypothetical protein
MRSARHRWTPAALLILAGSCHAIAASPFPASIDLSTLNGTDGFVLNGIDPSDFSGRSVSCAGDVNGDGVDDLIIGAYGASPNGQSFAGESYVVFGRPTSACCLGATTCIDGITASQCAGVGGTFFEATNCANVICPGCAGDINGDGQTDVFDFGIFAGNFGCGLGP